MKKILFVFLFVFLFSTVVFGQRETVSVTSAGDDITTTFPAMLDSVVKYWYIPFQAYSGATADHDTSSVTPSGNWLEAGTWGLAFKFDSSAACADGDYDSIYVWIKPMLHDGEASTNDSTFIKLGATNPNDYTATTAQRFDPLPSNRAAGTDYWYTCTLSGEIWPFAGVIVGIYMDDQGGKISPTFRMYRYR
jgi:hypothetical protein